MNNYNPNFTPAPEAPKKSKWPLIIALLAGGTLCMLVACIVIIGGLTVLGSKVEQVSDDVVSPPIGLPTRVPQATRTVESNGIISDDGSFQITRPHTMRPQADLHADALLQIADLMEEQYLIVIPDDVQVLQDAGINFEDYQTLIIDQTVGILENGSIDDSTSVVVNGLNGSRHQVSGTIENIDLVYFITLLEGPDAYYQITTWTLSDMVSDNAATLIDASDSFELIR